MPENPPTDSADPVVYLIDDNASVRAALHDLLSSVGLYCQSYASTQEFLAQPLSDAPACLVLDVRMPQQSGLDFQKQMKALQLHYPVIFITGHGDIAMCSQAMKMGAIDFLEKPFRDQELLDAIQRGIAQDRQQRVQQAASKVLHSRWQDLTAGEREVVRLVVQGLPNKQIAEQIHVSEITVKVRRSSAMRKLQASSLASLVRLVDQIEVSLPA